MLLFAELRHELEKYLTLDEVETIYQAYSFAEQAHRGQQRHSGDPYITHPLAVALILAEMRMDAQTILAAILHDVIEDTATDKIALSEKFSPEVAELVDGVSKLTQVQFQTRAEAQAENFRKMLLAMAHDIRVIIIKLADRLHNMRTLGPMPAEKRYRIARETLDIYAPIASRLGMYAFRVEFEDLSFAALYPLRYQVLQERVRQIKRYRRNIMGQIEGQLKDALEKATLPPSVVWGRQKHLYSIYRDMREKHQAFSEVMDSYTFCIVVESVDTCYRVLGVMHNLYKPFPEKFHDYIALPKANGYQALHTRLFGPEGTPIEIQIRTVEMDNIADNGIVTHWRFNYAEGAHNPAHLHTSEWLKRLLEIQETTGNPLEFIENVKIDLFPQEVYVFTPTGEIKQLPKGATPLDFAYAIHSGIGDHAKTARINRRPALLSTPLVSGQMVEIITDETIRPSPSWLSFAVTGKARSNILHFLKNQRRTEAIRLGKQLLENAFTMLTGQRIQLDLLNFQRILKKFSYKKADDLFEAIGLGESTAISVAQTYLAKESIQFVQKQVDTLQPLRIKNMENSLLKYADCCRPIPGDSIIGRINVGEGIVVHVANCTKAKRKQAKVFENNYVSLVWDKKIEGFFKVDIRLEVINEYGVLAELAHAISLVKANIDNISMGEQQGNYCVVRFTLSVRDRTHLARIMRRLRHIKTVMRIQRGK